MTFIFRNGTIFWDIPKWNRGQTKWDGGSILRKMSMHIIKDTLISNILLPRMHKNFKKRHSLSHFFFG